MTRDPIRRYLAELSDRLSVEASVKRDIVAEVGDHLREGMRGELVLGRAEQDAAVSVLTRFGPADELARRMSGRTRRIRPDVRPHGRRPRAPGVAHAGLVVVLLVVVGAVALTSRRQPPPTIAEFAPQAVEQITASSGDEAAQKTGGASNAAALDESRRGEIPTRPTTDVARVRQCVGDPPRQIEDPQSPPCVPYWEGDNGGATSRGVTRDEIRVTDAYFSPQWSRAFEAFFNRRFEFYGRRIRLVPRTVPLDPAGQRAGARAAYEQDQAFASTGYDGYEYADELSRLGVVVANVWSLFPETYMAARRPYPWTYPMANDRQFALLGNWFCARFAGRNATHAGDPLLQTSRRKIGVILTNAAWEGTSVEPMQAQLAGCGERAGPVIRIDVRFRDWLTPESYPPFENAMLQMKTSGVTTLVCLCYAWYTVKAAMPAATKQGYFPEWLVTSFVNHEHRVWFSVYAPPEQTKSLMLLLPTPMERSYTDHPSNWAIQETNRADGPADENAQITTDRAYRMLLLLASGFQMAGPHLTAETLERGLHRSRFPNPSHRIMPGAVGFEDGDHSMTDDAAEIWWSNSAPNPYPDEGVGTFCYIDEGARRRIGTFPRDDPFFRGPCYNAR